MSDVHMVKVYIVLLLCSCNNMMNVDDYRQLEADNRLVLPSSPLKHPETSAAVSAGNVGGVASLADGK